MTASTQNPASELDTDLELVLIAAGCVFLMVWLARTRVITVRRELEAARSGRDRARQELADARRDLDGALGELHKVAGERDRAINGDE